MREVDILKVKSSFFLHFIPHLSMLCIGTPYNIVKMKFGLRTKEFFKEGIKVMVDRVTMFENEDN